MSTSEGSLSKLVNHAESNRGMKLHEYQVKLKYGDCSVTHADPKLCNLFPYDIHIQHKTDVFLKMLIIPDNKRKLI